MTSKTFKTSPRSNLYAPQVMTRVEPFQYEALLAGAARNNLTLSTYVKEVIAIATGIPSTQSKHSPRQINTPKPLKLLTEPSK